MVSLRKCFKIKVLLTNLSTYCAECYRTIHVIIYHFDVQVNSSGSQKNSWIAHGFAGSHVNIFAPVWVTDLVEVSKHAASLVVCTWKKNFCLGVRVFC